MQGKHPKIVLYGQYLLMKVWRCGIGKKVMKVNLSKLPFASELRASRNGATVFLMFIMPRNDGHHDQPYIFPQEEKKKWE
mmetsp:Transcript_21926/g.32633  ORF Transcript_21926/g.32633 Transcript_21926/m.32633 type:complete len:80 (-) Transcript_21926:121-360(-)